MKDRKDDFEEMEFQLKSLERDLAIKSSDLDLALDQCHTLEMKLLEKQDIIADLQSHLDKFQESLHLVSDKNHQMKGKIDHLILDKETMQEEIMDKRKMIERLEEENLNQCASIAKMSELLEDFKCDFVKVNQEKNCLESETNALKEQLEMAHVLADEHEAVATEARQVSIQL